LPNVTSDIERFPDPVPTTITVSASKLFRG
jgi:hypothetical protein